MQSLTKDYGIKGQTCLNIMIHSQLGSHQNHVYHTISIYLNVIAWINSLNESNVIGNKHIIKYVWLVFLF